MKKRQRAARGGELVQKQDRGVEARVRGAPRVPLAVGVSKGPGSSFRVYEVTGCGARYVWHHKREVAALEFLIKKLKRVARASKEKGGARHGRLQARDGGSRPTRFRTRRLSRRCSRGCSRCAPLWTRPRRRRNTATSNWTRPAVSAKIAVGPRDFSFAHRHHRKAPKGEGHGKQQK